MKKYILLSLVFLLTANYLSANVNPEDSLKVVDMEEIIVIATPKENRKLRELPNAVTLLSRQDMQATQVNSIKNLTALVPNMFIPDYGSKLTSAIYIRGIGSRINTPSVGLYVDNIPYIDKSAFDFNYSDIERIDILRGPQGTLYGRNTMGGLIKVHTKSPFGYQGTDVRLSAGTYDSYSASLTHYHRISERFAFSAGGFYEYGGGFFKNSFLDNKKVDHLNDAGGRIRGIYLPSENLKIDMNVSYEYSDQGGYPYFYTGNVDTEKEQDPDYIGKISTNEEAYYRRNLLNAGITIEHQARNFILSAVTGYQYLNDRMHIDQDFTRKDYFNLTQKQKYNTLSEEIVFKSKPGRNWQWATGIFGFYQWLKTEGPVTFKREGVEDIIEANVNNIFAGLPAGAPKMGLSINNTSIDVSGNFDTPMWNGAIYHQSTFNNLFTKGLSFTAGLRADYEKMSMKYNSIGSVVNFDFDFNMERPPLSLNDNMDAPAELKGKLKNDYLQLLPKFALQYEWKYDNSVYATVSRGYRSGGYNVQMFSNLIQSELRNSMKAQLLESDQFGKHWQYGERMTSMIDGYMEDLVINVKGETTYKPEYSWNYEAGSHLTLWNGRLWADLAAFYMDTRDQQVSQFAPDEGLGRITVNAGKSRSYGAEAALRASITESLSFNMAYGYTRSTFRDYRTLNENNVEINYKGNYVPFSPKHTFNVGGQYIFHLGEGNLLDRIQLNLNYSGAGRIYWNEQNNASQPFYGTLNGRLAFAKGNGEVALWARNIFDEKYRTFYFESRGNGFEQRGRPIQIGVEMRCVF